MVASCARAAWGRTSASATTAAARARTPDLIMGCSLLQKKRPRRLPGSPRFRDTSGSRLLSGSLAHDLLNIGDAGELLELLVRRQLEEAPVLHQIQEVVVADDLVEFGVRPAEVLEGIGVRELDLTTTVGIGQLHLTSTIGVRQLHLASTARVRQLDHPPAIGSGHLLPASTV